MKLLSLDDSAWMEFVAARPDASIFHHPAWAGLLADCYGYPVRVVALTGSGETVTAGLPMIDVSRPLGRRRWISLPFTDCCPALAGTDPDELLSALVDFAASRKLDALELRGALPSHRMVQSEAAFVRHTLALSADTRPTWDGLWKNHRRNVRIAERAGVRIERGAAASDLDVFYRLHLQTRRRLGVPVQPRRFFRLLGERILADGLGFVLTAYSGDVPVAAAIFGAWNGTLVYKYSARDERYAKLDANYLLLWTAIEWGSKNGFHTFDLGRTDLDQSQLRSFKSGWGAREEPLSYSWIADAPINLAPRRLEGAMSVVIRRSAPWVCRTVGELFYRYAA
jgi:CelD/BcsL family acetyltransferase involved in cellulose biosynthesis